MQLFGSTFSPYVRKTVAFAKEKGMALEVTPVRFASDDPAFREASPFGKMPGFRDGDFAISDSTAIITYLEAVKPDPALIPAAPKSRARTIWYEEFADTILIASMARVFFNRVVAPRFLRRPGDEAAAEKAVRDELPPLFDYIEKVMPASGHLVDDRLTLADLAVASPLVNLAHCGVGPDPARYPRLAAFAEAILGRPSFAPAVAEEKAALARG